MLRDIGPPPGPKMRRPGGKPGQREMSIFEPTKDSYASGSQLSSAILRLARAALSAEEMAEFLISPISIKLVRIDEALLYQDKGGGYWLSCVCSFDEDAKGRMVVAQSIPKERYAAGEKGPAVGTWREIGGNNASSGKPAFDLAKYKKSPAPDREPPAPEQPPSTAGGTGDGPLFLDEEEGTP
jgi:hypothetical protein